MVDPETATQQLDEEPVAEAPVVEEAPVAAETVEEEEKPAAPVQEEKPVTEEDFPAAQMMEIEGKQRLVPAWKQLKNKKRQ